MNATLATLDDGESSLGAWISSMSPRVMEVLGGTDLDWLVVDMEHTPIGFDVVEEAIRAIDRNGTTPFVRLPELESVRGASKRALDSGAQGIIVPRVESPAQAKQVVDATHFPPDGERGMAGGVRAARYGRGFDQYAEEANDAIIVCVMIETVTGVERASEILSVDGVDGVFIGENDLSASYGSPGEKDLPAVQNAVDSIREAAVSKGVYTGLVAADSERLARRRSEGFELISIGSDLSLVASAVDERLSGGS